MFALTDDLVAQFALELVTHALGTAFHRFWIGPHGRFKHVCIDREDVQDFSVFFASYGLGLWCVFPRRWSVLFSRVPNTHKHNDMNSKKKHTQEYTVTHWDTL